MKKFFAKIHLWLSIPFGIIIAIVCLTGAILVFETEILEFCYPSRYFVKEVKGEMLSPAVLMGAAGQQLPDSIKINGIRVSSDPKRTYQLILPGKKAACFINPYTGEITGIDDGKGFFMKIMRLHRWLLDEYKRDGSFAWGKTIVGYSTLVLAIIIISGLVIWYPRNRKALKNRFKIKTKAGWFRFLYDLHVSGGFYAALLLLILALTGLTWSFGIVTRSIPRSASAQHLNRRTLRHLPSPKKQQVKEVRRNIPKPITHNGPKSWPIYKAVIRNINRSPSKTDRQPFLPLPMEIQEEATVIPLTRLPARSLKFNYTRTSLNPPK